MSRVAMPAKRRRYLVLLRARGLVRAGTGGPQKSQNPLRVDWMAQDTNGNGVLTLAGLLLERTSQPLQEGPELALACPLKEDGAALRVARDDVTFIRAHLFGERVL